MKTLACLTLALALAAPALAQQRGQFGGRGQGGVASLIRNESVQKELKMEKEQTDKATEAVTKIREKHNDEFSKLRDLSQEERRTKTTALNKVISDETLAALETVLKPEQVKRLKEIDLQQAGVAAFTRVEVEKALKLNDEQKGKVKAIAEESSTKMRELRGGTGGGRPQRTDQEKVTALRKEMMNKGLEVLNDEQKGTWKTMVGEAFAVVPSPPRKKDN
jgi:hypothetical protein